MVMQQKGLADVQTAVRAAYNKAQEVIGKNQLDYGIELLKAIVQRNPGFTDARTRLRQLEQTKYKRMNGFSRFFASFKANKFILKGRAIMGKRPLDGMALAEEALALNVYCSPALTLLADAAQKAEAPFICVEAYELLLEHNSKNESCMNKLAEFYKENGNGRKLLQMRQMLASKDPTNLEKQAALREAAALATIEEGKWNEEKSAAQKLKEREKSGKKETKQGDKIIRAEEDIKEEINKILEEAKANADISAVRLRELAGLYMRINEFQKAIDQYDVIVKKMGTLDPAIDKLIEKCHMSLSDHTIETLKAQNAGEEAIQAERDRIFNYRMERGLDRLRLYPNDLMIKYDLAVLYWESKEVDKALELFQQAQRNPQKRLLAIGYLGRCFAYKEQYDMAVEQFEKALADMPVMNRDKMEFLYDLGEVYEKLENGPKALECFKQIYSNDLTFRDVSDRINAYYKKK